MGLARFLMGWSEASTLFIADENYSPRGKFASRQSE